MCNGNEIILLCLPFSTLAPGIVDGRRNSHLQPVQLLRQHDLAAQPGRIGQLVGQVQHVQFLVAGLFRQGVKICLREDQMTRRAGQRSLARPESVQIELVVDDHVQKRVSEFALGLYPVSVGAYERDLDFFVLQLWLGRGQIPAEALNKSELPLLMMLDDKF